MAFKSLMITKINTLYTAEHIAYILLTREIAYVSSITLIPQIYNGEIFNIAYIDILSYCDTEAAYQFIDHIKSGFSIFYHDNNDNNNIWVFQVNTHNSGELSVGDFTTYFMQKRDITNDNDNDIHTETHTHTETHKPILGIYDDHYSPPEALHYLSLFTDHWHSVNTAVERRLIEDVIQHFDNELRIHHSVLNSQHVTLRNHY